MKNYFQMEARITVSLIRSGLKKPIIPCFQPQSEKSIA